MTSRGTTVLRLKGFVTAGGEEARLHLCYSL